MLRRADCDLVDVETAVRPEDVHQPPTKKLKPNGRNKSRAPYTAAACDQCHGRKLKCSGDRPCVRCKKQGISCSYPLETPRNHGDTDFNLMDQQLEDNM